MAYDLVVEDPERFFFITNRTIGSRLWFVNNPVLHERICAHLAKYAELYGVVVVAFVLMGNHYHLIARFPRGNRSAFLRSFDAMIAKLVKTHVKEFEEGPLWHRRPKVQVLPNPEDVENWFFYAALNPVSSGLAERLSDYPTYNSFSDAVSGRTRTHKVFRRKEYNDRKRFKSDVKKSDFIDVFELSYARVPGYEELSQREYRKIMHEKFAQRRVELIEKRRKAGRGFAHRRALRDTAPGAKPRTTKTSSRDSLRPLVLTLCQETRKFCLELYFATLDAYKRVSALYRSGNRTVLFPKGTYAPIVPPQFAA